MAEACTQLSLPLGSTSRPVSAFPQRDALGTKAAPLLPREPALFGADRQEIQSGETWVWGVPLGRGVLRASVVLTGWVVGTWCLCHHFLCLIYTLCYILLYEIFEILYEIYKIFIFNMKYLKINNVQIFCLWLLRGLRFDARAGTLITRLLLLFLWLPLQRIFFPECPNVLPHAENSLSFLCLANSYSSFKTLLTGHPSHAACLTPMGLVTVPPDTVELLGQ